MNSIDKNREPSRGEVSKRRRGGTSKASRVQAGLSWAALLLIGWALLRNGGVAPLIWHLMCIVTVLLFAVQVVLDVQQGLPRSARAAMWPAAPFFVVLCWLLVQRMAGLPPGLAHPIWTFAPEGAVPTISAHPDASGPIVMRFTCYAMLFWIFVRSAGAAPAGGIVYIKAVALFSTALALYGMASIATGFNLLLEATERTGALRASLWNRNSYATVAVFGVLANVVAYMHVVSGNSQRRGLVALRDFLETFFAGAWLYAFGVMMGLAALALTFSRGGTIAGLVGMILLVWALQRGMGKAKLRTLAIPVALSAFVALFMSSGVLERLKNSSSESRPEVFGQVIVGISDRPLLGHGAGTFVDTFRPYKPLSQVDFTWEQAHNSYLENAFEFGLPAATLLFVSLGLVGWRLFQAVRTRKRHRGTPAFALACFAAAAVHSVVDFSLQIPAIAALFAAILGIGWGQSFPTRRSAGDGRDG